MERAPHTAPPRAAGSEPDDDARKAGPTPHVLCIGGGRPGVGHSIIAVNLAVYLAQLSRKVVLVDADSTGACLHTMLGLELPERETTADPLDVEELLLVPTAIPGLKLLPQEYSHASTAPRRPGRTPRWAKGLRQLDADYVILDVGPGTAPAALDLFLAADFGITVTSPDPIGVEATYRFVRAVFLRQVKRLLLKDRYKARLVERALSALPALPGPLEVLAAIDKYDHALADVAASQLASLRNHLVVSGTRLRQDAELLDEMGELCRRYLGAVLDPLGYVEHDDAIWLSVVRRRPLLLDNQSGKSPKSLERIARRVVAVATARETPRPSVAHFRDVAERSLYDVLWTHPGASDEELRRAYKRQRTVFQPGSLPLTSLLGRAEQEHERERVEEAQDTLLDPVRRRSYDLSFFPGLVGGSAEPQGEESASVLAERELLRAELAHEIHSETEYSGALLTKVRESQGIDLEEIAKKTKISLIHLRAIEDEDFAALPAEVYTRGFVGQLARLLGLDSTQASRTYLRRYRLGRRSANLA